MTPSFIPSRYVTGLRCILCGAEYSHADLHTCPRCGPQGILDVAYDYDAVRLAWRMNHPASRPLTMWRYKELIPVSDSLPRPFLQIGATPVYDVPGVAAAIGAKRVLLKDDGRNPTNSFKDRASAVGVLKAMEFGFTSIACASTGNAASSLAGLSAATGLSSFIFVPERAPDPKITQLLIFGATVIRVQGSYEDAFDLCTKACDTFGWYNRNSGTNPFLVEGKKTAGLEIADQCSQNLPEWVVVSVGDGCTVGGIGKGLREMLQLGFIPRMPRLLGVQAEGARPVHDAFYSGKDLTPTQPSTLADSIAVGTPRNWRRAIREIRGSDGEMITVTDDEILDAMRLTARLGGVFGEPAGVAGVAGLRKAIKERIVKPEELSLVVITGNGLKDTASARRAAGAAITIPPDVTALERALSARGEKGR
jgi:threonine synthase